MDTENSPFSSVDASDLSLEQTFARTDAREPLTEVQRSIRFCDSPGDSTQKSSLKAKTPCSHVYHVSCEAEADSSSMDDLKAVLMWQNPAVSALAFLCGCLTCLAIDFGLNGSHGLNFVTGLCFALLTVLGLNFLRGLVSAKWLRNSHWSGSSAADAAAAQAANVVRHLASWHDTLLASSSPTLTSQVTILLSLSAYLGSLLSFWRLVLVAFVAVFTLPVGYQSNQASISDAWAQATATVQGAWVKAGLSRRSKLCAIAGLIMLIWIISPWPTRLMLLLNGMVAIRCHLQPGEVKAVRDAAKPYTKSVGRNAKRLSMAASGAFVAAGRRMSTPSRATPRAQ
ncbi:hypothetical protein WJX74_009090 [Apatococcus lobatus]|uniref:Reticulon-like protein n=2 Tax=Apatococcus TaxID=904362 RepID=A0AAW1RYB8_9CHLO